MLKDTSPLFRGVCISATLYAGLFLGHIVAAALEWNMIFKIIAILISLMTFLVGPSIIVFGKITNIQEKIQANSFGFPISILLAVGLAWAYEDQSFDIVRTLSFLCAAIGVHLIQRQLIQQKHSEKMG